MKWDDDFNRAMDTAFGIAGGVMCALVLLLWLAGAV